MTATTPLPDDDPWAQATGQPADPVQRRKEMVADIPRLVAKFQSLIDAIDAGLAFLRDAAEELTEARYIHEIAYAKKILEAAADKDLKSKDMREAWALTETATTWQVMLIAERKADIANKMVRAYTEEVRAFQSISVLIRQQGG